MHFLSLIISPPRFFLPLVLAASALLLASCGGGGGSSAPGPEVAVNGKVTFDAVPTALTSSSPRLDYPGTVRRPARSVTVEAIDINTQSVLASASTDAAGNYTLAVPSGRSVFVRAKAAMTASGSNAAAIAVVDNTSGGAQWAIDSAGFTSGSAGAAMTQNLNAGSGWNGSAYVDAQRAAGPFAILDTLYVATQRIILADPAIAFPKLDVNWSPNNIAATGDLALGQIGTSFFIAGTSNGQPVRRMYLLGRANNDTDEYDAHVVAHEFGHYLQNAFSRDDSIGGPHGGPDDRLDMRVAFSEGWGNAWSGIALNDPVYTDTIGANQAGGIAFNVSLGTATNPGWFKEPSVQKMFWDFSQNSPDIGFTQVWATMKTGMKASPALTGIHAFARSLANGNAGATNSIRTILATQGIALPNTPYADNETNFGTPTPLADTNPIYLSYGGVGTSLTNVCVNNAVDPARAGNKAGEYRYIRLTLPQAGQRIINVTGNSSTPTSQTDPDLVLYSAAGAVLSANGTNPNSESASGVLPAGDYVLVVTDFNLAKSASAGGNTRACFTVTIQ
ncbi:MAG: hypothetical protein B7X59_02045 [Polaromonas sp. 39-63-203]|jgi:hypothetical protein|uniref:hypothetical protein n=1 Tax=Polaromonas sp. TaxID=1869339 RepID=UPI000BCEFF00|nr:hypothetical protein [Polaromonas sp.]OYY53691.1 MAG: hypothetical protein B7Y54_01990 [Polaromonas sp. 35-63-240]OYZ01569.1 MAG: hypothetical protein B7Y42_03195 [Polaromonas sp. 28-63-22]OYZ84693.1 MAG: hypothetical protein B7Y03_02495 [Polaromonas sp. 24-62-144]OZB01057.1 MAG: hypothetical protein B7X59_02045 [Polaromonas sp. 39-63-203]HQS31889.1 hypothetical protein [Polaromonas sp.]